MTNPYDNPDTPEVEEGDNPYSDTTDESGGDIAGTQQQQDDRLDDLETNQTALQGNLIVAEADIDVLEASMIVAEADIDHLEDALDQTELTGFPNRTDSTVSFTDGTRTLSIAPAVTSFSIWQDGVKYTKSAEETLVIADTEGVHLIYYDLGVLTDVVNPTSAQIDTVFRLKAPVRYIYWDATNNLSVYDGEERHGLVMDGATHTYEHFKEGMAYLSGLAPTDILVDEDGSSDTHAQVGIALGVVADEDISRSISVIASTVGFRVNYKDGASGNWRFTDVSGFPFINASSGRPYWNEYTGGAWQKTEMTDNNFILVHLFASSSVADPVFVIMGENLYTNKITARAGALVELDALLLDISLTAELTPIATIIVQGKTSYTNSVNARFVSTDDGDDYIDFRTSRNSPSGGNSVDHNSLDGLQGGAAGEYYHLTDAEHTAVAGVPGEIKMFGGSSTPSGFLACDGTAISRTTYSALFTAIGELWGVGDGSTTFNVPDLRGSFIRGSGSHGSATMADGNPFAGGSVGGSENDQMQGHWHRYNYATDSAAGGVKESAAPTGSSFDTGVTVAVTDGVNGTPRIGDETRPFNNSVLYIIKI